MLRRLRRAFARGPSSTYASPIEPETPPLREVLDAHADELDADDAAVFGTTDWVLTARDASALLIYGAFDPVDPVLSAVTLIDFGGRRSQTIVHARLSPFAQQFSVLATLCEADADADESDRVYRALIRICVQNGDPMWPLLQRTPTFIAATTALSIGEQRNAYRRLFAHAPDIGALAAALAQHPNDPWARATARFQHGHVHVEGERAIDEYVARAMAPAHLAQEIDALPNAWKSAIDYQIELGRVERVARALSWEDVAAYLAKLSARR